VKPFPYSSTNSPALTGPGGIFLTPFPLTQNFFPVTLLLPRCALTTLGAASWVCNRSQFLPLGTRNRSLPVVSSRCFLSRTYPQAHRLGRCFYQAPRFCLNFYSSNGPCPQRKPSRPPSITPPPPLLISICSLAIIIPIYPPDILF